MLLTPEEFLAIELNMGISADNEGFMQLAEDTANQIDFEVDSIMDFGAGIGAYTHAFKKKFPNTKAFEIWEPHQQYIKLKFPDIELMDEPQTTDLMLFIEVAEHMTDHEIISLFNKIAPQRILFSSTPYPATNDAEWGHINLKQPQAWDAMFDSFGYDLERPLNKPTAWAKMYKRR